MTRHSPTPRGLALGTLRRALGLQQTEAAEATGIRNRQISRYETGESDPGPEELARAAEALGASPEALEEALLSSERLLALLHEEPPGDTPVDPTPAEHRRIVAASARAARLAGHESREALARELRARKVRRDRRRAATLWKRLAAAKEKGRRLLLERTEGYRSWAVCERLCEESVRAAADDPRRALDLARLALRVAEASTEGGEAWRLLLQAYAWAFVGNALRVTNRLREAGAAFERSHALWDSAPPPADPGPLDASRRLDLEASLRRGQRRFEEALALLARAEAACFSKIGRAHILLNVAYTWDQMERPEEALAVLGRVAPLVDARTEPRQAFALLYNTAGSLARLGRPEEAEALLPKVRALAEGLGNVVDLIRVVWLEGYTAGALGRAEEGIAALEQVRRGFNAREMPYDAALAGLDLAELLLREGRAAGVRRLAEEMVAAFRAQGVEREALAALEAFREAAIRERVTAELARRVARFLARARREPRLRFEGEA